jgi:hypothetical protein
MAIWMPTHTISTTTNTRDLGDLAEILILGDIKGSERCHFTKVDQTASHIHLIHII